VLERRRSRAIYGVGCVTGFGVAGFRAAGFGATLRGRRAERASMMAHVLPPATPLWACGGWGLGGINRFATLVVHYRQGPATIKVNG
jgi:hypothetical protein